jgi:virginiamycin A acetyltransferase
MNVTTSDDCVGISADHPWAKHSHRAAYRDGAFSLILNNFFKDWLDEEAQAGTSSMAERLA